MPSRVFAFGAAGDVPLIGEWDLDGRDEIGVYRTGRWLLRNTLTPGPPSLAFTYGGSRSRPVVWN